MVTPGHPACSLWQGLAAGGRSLGEALPRAAPRPVPPTTSRLLRLGNTSDLAICMFAELGCRSSAVSVYYLVGRKVPPSAQVVGSLRNGRRRKATKKRILTRPSVCPMGRWSSTPVRRRVVGDVAKPFFPHSRPPRWTPPCLESPAVVDGHLPSAAEHCHPQKRSRPTDSHNKHEALNTKQRALQSCD